MPAPIPIKQVPAAESLATISNVLLSALIISALFFGREILVPLALSALLTFMLAPLVTKLQRWLGRVGAVLFVVLMMVLATGAVGWVLTRQVVDLANQLPNYKENIQTKLRSIQMNREGAFSKISRTLDELKKDLPGGDNNSSLLMTDAAKQDTQKAIPVEVVSGRDERLKFVQVVLAPVLGPLGTAALVLLLLVFMLLQREDLRNRLIRLIGQGRISATTSAMDDAGSRVSKYLLMQLVVNVTYGIPVAVGLFFIGVPNALLWGALSAVLRFIPYLGPWIAAAFPIVLSLAVSPDWMAPALTIGLFVGLELFSNNVMEPWLYGSSTGVSPIALIVAALFWTLLWGPVGLVLATPLTVCMVVMGRYIPKLAFLSIILSDEEALTPMQECYHRLQRAGEHDEMEFVDAYLKSNPPEALFDSVLIPVIIAAETDHRLDLLDAKQLEFVKRGLWAMLEELEIGMDVAEPAADDRDLLVGCVPAKAERDELAGEMFARLLRHMDFTAANASSVLTAVERVAWVRKNAPKVVCVSAAPPTTIIHCRYLCSKLRAAFPDLKILVGIWGAEKRSDDANLALKQSGADEVVTTLADAAAWVESQVSAIEDHPPMEPADP